MFQVLEDSKKYPPRVETTKGEGESKVPVSGDGTGRRSKVWGYDIVWGSP